MTAGLRVASRLLRVRRHCTRTRTARPCTRPARTARTAWSPGLPPAPGWATHHRNGGRLDSARAVHHEAYHRHPTIGWGAPPTSDDDDLGLRGSGAAAGRARDIRDAAVPRVEWGSGGEARERCRGASGRRRAAGPTGARLRTPPAGASRAGPVRRPSSRGSIVSGVAETTRAPDCPACVELKDARHTNAFDAVAAGRDGCSNRARADQHQPRSTFQR